MFNPRVLTSAYMLSALLTAGVAGGQEAGVDDPMRPFSQPQTAGGPTTDEQAAVLTAVVISPSRRIAVINGKLLREGDEIAGRRIDRIESRSVVLSRNDNSVEIFLKERNVDEPTIDGESES